MPLTARVLPAGRHREAKNSQSFFGKNLPNILMVSARSAEDGSGIVLHLRELDGMETEMNVNELLKSGKIRSVSETNVLGEKITDIQSEIKIQPYSIKFLKFDLE